MNPDKRAILEAAAKACGIDGIWQEGYGVFIKGNYMLNPGERPKFFNPIDNSLDTSAMCAVLDIDTYWFPKKNLVICCRDGRGLDTSTMKNTTAPPKARNPLGDSRQAWWLLRLEDTSNELSKMRTSQIFWNRRVRRATVPMRRYVWASENNRRSP